MAVWRYIGCNTKQLPKELRSQKILSINEIKELLDTIPLVEGKLEAINEEAVVALLLHDKIMPLRLHKMTKKELKVENLKTLIAKHNQRI